MKQAHKKLVLFSLLGRLFFRPPSYYLPLTTTWQRLDKRAFFLCSGNTRIPVSTPTRSLGWKEIASINSFQRRPRSKIKNTFAFEPGTEKANTGAREQQKLPTEQKRKCQQNFWWLFLVESFFRTKSENKNVRNSAKNEWAVFGVAL